MYYLQFFRTCFGAAGQDKFIFQRASGYGVYVDGVEYAIARVTGSGKEWDITEVSTGLSLDVDHEHITFPTREAALRWLKGFVQENDIEARIRKHADVRKALAAYSEPFRVKKRERKTVGEVKLTPKQSDFLKRYAEVIGADSCETKEVAKELNMSPSTVGAMISTLVEKDVFETFLEGRTRYLEPTEIGLIMMVGASIADCECLLVPTVVMALGALLLWEGYHAR